MYTQSVKGRTGTGMYRTPPRFLILFLGSFGQGAFWWGVAPVVIPAVFVVDGFEEFATVDMHHGAFAGEKSFDAAGAVGGELVGGGLSLAAGTMAGYDEARIDDGADEGSAFVDGLSVLLVGMKGESKLTLKIVADDIDIAHKLMFLGHGDDNEKVVDVAAIMFVTEI